MFTYDYDCDACKSKIIKTFALYHFIPPTQVCCGYIMKSRLVSPANFVAHALSLSSVRASGPMLAAADLHDKLERSMSPLAPVQAKLCNCEMVTLMRRGCQCKGR